MTNYNIELIIKRLELAIRIDDKEYIIESCAELVEYKDEIDPNQLAIIYNVMAITHLKLESYLKSYQTINTGLAIKKTDLGIALLDCIKEKIIESPRH